MIDHVTIWVSNLERSKAFYDPALGAIGIASIFEYAGQFVGYGTGQKPFFWIGVRSSAITGVHVAFAVQARSEVARFYDAALGAGGRGNGTPGLRPLYHPNYYGAFALDPDGHNIEAVCHGPDAD